VTWDLNPVFFTIPGLDLSVRYYGLIFSLNFILGLILYAWQVRRAGRSLNEAMDMVWPAFIGLVCGARLGHVFFYNFDYFLKEPLWLFRVWEGGLASHGAAIGLVGAIAWRAYRDKRPFWDLFDRLTFSGALGAGLIRLGNFFNSEIVGKITTASWGVHFPRYDWQMPPDLVPARYPSQLVEFGAGLLILGLLLILDRLAGRENRPRGLLSAAFLILYFTARFLMEFLKERHGAADDLWLSKGQLLSILPLAFGVGLLIMVLKKAKKAKS
jgi:prolipoprotein diacylglyceryl transferase